MKYDIERVQEIQRRLQGLRNYSYADRLKLLNLSSVKLRRIRSDLAWCYKIVFGLTIIKFDDFFQWCTAPQTRGHPYRLYKTSSTRRARTVFFSKQVINVWNRLPMATNFGSLPLFMVAFGLRICLVIYISNQSIVILFVL